MFTTLNFNTGDAPRTKSSDVQALPRRAQVRRACDWCKLMRIKCDNHRPCFNCHQKGHECATGRQTQFRSLAAAVKEVESLRGQVGELETVKKQLEELRGSGTRSESDSRPTTDPAAHGASPAPPANTSSGPPLPQETRSDPDPDWVLGSPPERPVSTTGTADASVAASTPGGIASSPLFLARMRRFLEDTRPQLNLKGLAQGQAASAAPPAMLDLSGCNYLSPDQEKHYLALFWQSHYFSYPILSEGQFARDYQALVANSIPGQPRPSSPLVHIVLALCMQIASFAIRPADDDPQRDEPDPPKHGHPSLAGFHYYRRCQEAIDYTVESPSVVTVQCYIFSIVYLYEAGLINMAQVATSKAITEAVILGLHMEPPPHLSGPEKERLRRIWWSLQALDARLSAEAGRSPVTSVTLSTCNRPTDSLEYAHWLAPHYHHDEACPPWLGFQTQTLRLLETVGGIRAAFDARYSEVVGDAGYDAFLRNGAAREDCARYLAEQVKELDVWYGSSQGALGQNSIFSSLG